MTKSILENILEESLELKEHYETKIKSLNATLEILKKTSPTKHRKNKSFWSQMDYYNSEIDDDKNVLDNCLESLTKSKHLMHELQSTIKKTKKISNTVKISSLQFLAKQAVKDNKIPLDEYSQAVIQNLEEPHNTEKYVHGGKNRKKFINRATKRRVI
jgi:hypothetical protein